MQKMIVLDLDGMLLNNERKVSKKSIEYLKKLKEQGYIITIATGRFLAIYLKATYGASFANYIICDTGANCFNKQNNTYLYQNFVPKEIVEEALSCYTEKCKYIDVCIPNKLYKYSNTIIENSEYNGLC